MENDNLFEKISELQSRFADFFQHRKKVKSLENYSFSASFVHKNYLFLVKNCLNDGFLDEIESKFLDHMLKKYELNYLDWSHKTKWLKSQMRLCGRSERRGSRPVQTFFDFGTPEQMAARPFPLAHRPHRRQARA